MFFYILLSNKPNFFDLLNCLYLILINSQLADHNHLIILALSKLLLVALLFFFLFATVILVA